jgi:spore germination protein GerM
MRGTVLKALLVMIAGAALLAACSDDDDDDATPVEEETEISSTVTAVESPEDTATELPEVAGGECPIADEPVPAAESQGGTPTPPGASDPQEIALLLYYPRLTETDFEFVAVPRVIDRVPDVPSEALELLIEGPTDSEANEFEISNPMPEGTELIELRTANGVAFADFSEKLLDFGGGALNQRTIGGMIDLTLKQFTTIQSVNITVEGQPADLPTCEGPSAEMVTLFLYYPRVIEATFVLEEVSRGIEPPANVAVAALELLIEGPFEQEVEDLDISDPIPEGTRVLSVEIVDGVATADFSEELLDFGGGSLNVQTITAMIEETLMLFPEVDEVVILVEGEPDRLQP